MSKPLTPLEQQLQQYAPDMFALHMLTKDEVEGGGGEHHLAMLLQSLVQYNITKSTGKIFINYSKGKIAKIEASSEITQNRTEEKQQSKTVDEEVIKIAQKLKRLIIDSAYGIK